MKTVRHFFAHKEIPYNSYPYYGVNISGESGSVKSGFAEVVLWRSRVWRKDRFEADFSKHWTGLGFRQRGYVGWFRVNCLEQAYRV